jgi:RimJ/RimL family protein N-acetyltransferase
MKAPALLGARIALRPLTEADLLLTLVWRNASREAFFHNAELTMAQHEAWFAKYLSGTDTMLIVEHDGVAIGQLGVSNHDGASIELGQVLMAPEQRRRGYMREAIALLLDWLKTQGITRVIVNLKPENTAATALYLAVGFGARQMEWMA